MNQRHEAERDVLRGVQRRVERRKRWLAEGEPTLAGQLARVGVLGWLIVAPALAGIALGRLIDRTFGTGIFWTAPLLFAGLAIGCWSAWKWMHRA